MKIGFSEIPEGGLVCDVGKVSWFPEQELQGGRPAQGRLRLVRQGADKVAVTGAVSLSVRLDCDRCLVAFERDIMLDLQLLLECGTANRWHVKEVECTREDLDVVQLDRAEIDISDLLRQHLYLALPEKSLCRADCKGLCGTCGKDLNSERCECSQAVVDSPFAVLSQLKE
jgi:uncharacterized protein